jgi:hypothetical protein
MYSTPTAIAAAENGKSSHNGSSGGIEASGNPENGSTGRTAPDQDKAWSGVGI